MAVAVAKAYRLTQFHASDREVLALVYDCLDEEGYTDSATIAAQFWPRAMSKGDSADARAAVHAVSTRLAYMARELGVVVRDAAKKSGLARWTITEDGEALLDGRLRAAVERGIEEMDDASAVVAMGTISQRIRRGDPFGQLMVRAFRYAYGGR